MLQLGKIPAQQALRNPLRKQFDLQRKPQAASNNLFLAGEKPRQRSKFKFLAGVLVAVLLLNLFSVFGRGKASVEKVVETAFSGLNQLTRASESFAAGNFAQSSNQFGKATEALRAAEKDLLMLSGAGVVLNQQPESIQAGSRLVSAGKMLGSAGENFAQAADELKISSSSWLIRQQAVTANQPVESFSAQLTSPIKKIVDGIGEMENAVALLDLVNPDSLPADLSNKVKDAKQQLNLFLAMVKPLSDALPQIPELLGNRTPRKYLILFQNPDEIRPTGGFIGSVGILTLNDGFVSKFEIKDVYSIDGQLTRNIQPPEGFGLITANWGLRDANYHPDFPTSAEAAAWLYEEAGFGSVDGVAAITSNLLRDLMKEVGGVKLARFKEKITSEDLNLILSLIIETKTDGVANPKQILQEVWEALREKLMTIPPQAAVNLTLNAIAQKDLQFWSEVSELQKIPTGFGIANTMQKTEGDYLYIVNTSLSGNKSDRYTSNKISHTTEIAENGSATDTLTITRSNTWSSDERNRITTLAKNFGVNLSDEMVGILGGDRNIDLVKVFLPLGSELINIEGMGMETVETKESLGKTYFILSITTQPSFSREIKLTYKLPQKFEENYSLVTEYQAGDKTTEIEKIVKREGKAIENSTLKLGEMLEVNL
jgi:DNA-directed RNA polymerase subunit L